jgi:hypothetical protein
MRVDCCPLIGLTGTAERNGTDLAYYLALFLPGFEEELLNPLIENERIAPPNRVRAAVRTIWAGSPNVIASLRQRAPGRRRASPSPAASG